MPNPGAILWKCPNCKFECTDMKEFMNHIETKELEENNMGVMRLKKPSIKT